MTTSKNTSKLSAILTAMAGTCLAYPSVFFSTAGTDRAYAITSNPVTGEIYVAGTAWTGAAAQNDLYVTKYDPVGAPMWTYRMGGGGNDTANDLVLRNGILYVAGTTQPGAATGTNAVVIALNTAGGAVIATQVVATPFNDGGKFVRLDGAGNVFLGGYSSTGANRDFMLARFTPGLVPVFTTIWGGATGDDEPKAMGLSANGVYLAGTGTTVAGDLDGLVARFSGAGAFIANRSMSGSAGLDDAFNDITIDGAGQVYLAGTRNTAGVGEEVRVLKFNAALTFNIWNTIVNYAPGAGHDRVNRIILTAGNTLTIGGRSWNAIGVGYDAFALRLDRAAGLPGVPWFYDFIDHDEILDLAEGPVGEMYATIYSDGPIGHDFATVRIDASAVSPWVKRYNNVNHDEPDCMTLAGPGRIVVTGASENVGTGFDWCTMGYDPTGVGIF